MYTDWILIRRLAVELEQRFRGARVRDAGQLDDGRFALALWAKGRTSLVSIDIFAPTPAITVEEGELPLAAEPGFVRTAGAALRGMTLSAVRSRKGDRLLRFDFGSRSRFGVEDGYSLICELVPRFGNIVLVKGQTVVAAAKEFAPSENAVRSVQAGHPYEAPPARPGLATRVLPEELAAQFADRVPDGDLHVYRREGELVQAHVVELPQYAQLQHERATSLLDLLAEARRSHVHAGSSDRLAKRRRSLERALGDRERKLRTELAQIEARLQEARNRETLREQGDAIYATLHELDAEERAQAKDRATQIFAKYKKTAASVEHLQRRQAGVARALQDAAELRWELERAGDAELADVAEAFAAFESRPGVARRTPVTVKRKPLQYVTARGSRIFVGRTPIENAELTFKLARPDDLWFHVQNQPGAHVILQRDDKETPPDEDILAAAALAALHSKAKNSPKVTVDFTQRKHVRKRPSAAPGLVFYTNPRSIYVEPRAPS